MYSGRRYQKAIVECVPFLLFILPLQSSAEDYEAMPIDQFGTAMLRGMGWKKGDPVGKSNKGLAIYALHCSPLLSFYILVAIIFGF